MSLITFPNQEKGIAVWDSGATRTLISQTTVDRNAYLRSIAQVKLDRPVDFTVGGGDVIRARTSLAFKITLQGHTFVINAHVVSCIGGVDLLIGTKALHELEANLCFRTRTIRFKQSGPLVKLTRNITIKPGETKIVTIRGNLPELLRSAELYFKPTRYFSQYTNELILVKMHQGTTLIAMHNFSNKTRRLNNVKPVGTFLVRQFGNVPITLNNYLDTDASSLHCGCYSAKTHHTGRVSETAPSPSETTPTSTHYKAMSPQTLSNRRRATHNRKREQFPYLDPDDPRLYMEDFDILKRDISLKDHCMEDAVLDRFWNTMNRVKEAFSLHDEIGECPRLQIHLKLKDESPFYIRPYSVSPEKKLLIDREVEKLRLMGVLEYSTGSYVSPMLLLKKRDGSYRLCADLRVLNTKIAPLHYSTPLLKDALQTLGNSCARVISTIDIKHAFYSLKVHRESRKYLGICPYPGARTLRYKRLVQGLNVSPTEWSDVIQEILSEIPNSQDFCLGIADDILIFSKDGSQHLAAIESVLAALAKNGLKVSLKKCQFFRRSLQYMGHTIRTDGKHPSIVAEKSKIEAITKLPVPKTKRQLKGYIGMVAYLSMYLCDLQTLLIPMHKLVRKTSPWIWSDEVDANFREINRRLIESPVLTLPSPTGAYTIYVDTSRVGTGSCLTQVQHGKECIVGYYSKQLPDAAARYSVSELECSGLLTNISAFRYILQDKHFTAVTDHSCLVQMASAQKELPTLRLNKFFEKLSHYDFDLCYKKGVELVISDFLSRNPTTAYDDLRHVAFIHQESKNGSPPRKANGQDGTMRVPRRNESAYVVTRSQARAAGDIVTGEGLLPVTRRTRVLTRAVEKEGTEPTLEVDNQANEFSPAPADELPAPIDDVLEHEVEFTVPAAEKCLDLMEGVQRERLRPAPRLEDIQQERLQPAPRYELRSRPLPPSLPTQLTDIKQGFNDPFHFRQLAKPLPVDAHAAVTTAAPEDWLFEEGKALFKPGDDYDLFYKSLPKQDDLVRMTNAIRKRMITDTHLPFDKARLAVEQTSDPFFGPIYNYLKNDHLPNTMRSRKRIKALSEDFVLADDILFKVSWKLEGDPSTPAVALVCIPTTLESRIFHAEHDGLFSNHLGISKVMATMNGRYYIRGLFNKLNHYIRSCVSCQQRKTPKDAVTEREYHVRIPSNYTPFSTLYADIKYMYPSSSGNKYMLVCVDDVTRFVEAIPLSRLDSQNIAEVFLRRIIFRYGPPRTIVLDEAASFLSQIAAYLWQAVGTRVICISPMNHGSSPVERSIGSLSTLIASNLHGTGKNWDLYIEACLYSHNSHVVPRTGYSPYYLVHMRPPPNLCNLDFQPLSDVKNSYRDYVEFMKQRLQFVGKTSLQIQERLQQRQAEEQKARVARPSQFREGLIVYLFAPSASSVHTNSLKFKSTYLGPLVVHTMMSNDKAILCDITGRILRGIYHVNRLKPAFIRTSTGSVGNMAELRKEYNKAELAEIQKTPLSAGDLLADERVLLYRHQAVGNRDNEVMGLDVCDTHLQFVGDGNVNNIDEHLYLSNATTNSGLASKQVLTPKQQRRELRRMGNFPEEGTVLSASKYRIKSGHMEIYVKFDYGRKTGGFWFTPEDHPEVYRDIREHLKTGKRIVGDLRKIC